MELSWRSLESVPETANSCPTWAQGSKHPGLDFGSSWIFMATKSCDNNLKRSSTLNRIMTGLTSIIIAQTMQLSAQPNMRYFSAW